jgi:hypothetical protein
MDIGRGKIWTGALSELTLVNTLYVKSDMQRFESGSSS